MLCTEKVYIMSDLFVGSFETVSSLIVLIEVYEQEQFNPEKTID